MPLGLECRPSGLYFSIPGPEIVKVTDKTIPSRDTEGFEPLVQEKKVEMALWSRDGTGKKKNVNPLNCNCKRL